MSSFGNRLIQLRKLKKLKQNQAAELIGISSVNLSRYEQDKRKPNKETLYLLANFYNVSPSYLLFGEENDYLDFLSDITKEEAMQLKEYLEEIRRNK
ncbi:helix-turn-helix domain-containing protein [Bacillus sp. IITD106]|nr:helix-turn-helix domain-containing protein [Bacillus sp. IITD106]